MLAAVSLPGLAGGETVKSPILDRTEVVYSAPENLDQLTLEELQAEKAVRTQDLVAIQQASDTDVARQKLLEIIFEHDDKRLQIVKVISELIDEYQIEGEFRNALLGYRDTFDVDIRDARKHVHTLDDYKSYDFRFSAVYMSMMFNSVKIRNSKSEWLSTCEIRIHLSAGTKRNCLNLMLKLSGTSISCKTAIRLMNLRMQ